MINIPPSGTNSSRIVRLSGLILVPGILWLIVSQIYNARLARAVIREDIDALEKILNDSPAMLEYRESFGYGMTPLHKAVFHGKCHSLHALIQRGADVNSLWRCGNYPESWYNPLMIAAINGHEEVAKMLLENGSNVNWKSDSGQTPLDIAVKNSHLGLAGLYRKKGGKCGKDL